MCGEPNDDVVTDNSKETMVIAKETLEKSVEAALIEEPTVASTAEMVKANGNVKPVEENGSVAATGDVPKQSVYTVNAC